MDFADIALVEQRHKSARLVELVHPDDRQRHLGATYEETGAAAIKLILFALSLTGLTEVRSILDNPCGYGLVGRHLRAAFPNAALYFCDEDERAAEFCAAQFAGSPIYSQPQRTVLPSRLDLIWAGSQPVETLLHIGRHLSRDGLIIASVPHKKPAKETIEAVKAVSGLAFLSFSELGWNDRDVVILRREA